MNNTYLSRSWQEENPNFEVHNLEISLSIEKHWPQVGRETSLNKGRGGGGSLDEKFCLRVRLLRWKDHLSVDQVIRVFRAAHLNVAYHKIGFDVINLVTSSKPIFAKIFAE